MISWVKRRLPDSTAGWFVWTTSFLLIGFAAFMVFVRGPELNAMDRAERLEARSDAYWFAQTCIGEGRGAIDCISACRDSAWFEACRDRVVEINGGK